MLNDFNFKFANFSTRRNIHLYSMLLMDITLSIDYYIIITLSANMTLLASYRMVGICCWPWMRAMNMPSLYGTLRRKNLRKLQSARWVLLSLEKDVQINTLELVVKCRLVHCQANRVLYG